MAKLAIALTAFLAFYSLTSQAGTIASYHVADADAPSVSRVFGLEHKVRGGFEVEIPSEQETLLRAIAPSARLLDADVGATLRAKLQRYSLTSARGYHSYDEVQSWIRAHAETNRELISVVDYGVSRQGRALTALHLAGPQSAGKPVVLITAATHGDELITTEVLMQLIDKLITGYGKEDRLTKIVDSHDLYFVPMVNADGFAATSRYDTGADPNRSYPWPGHENASPTPSIAAIMKLFHSLDVKGSIDFHAYGEMIMYPWAYTRTPIPAEPHAVLDRLTTHMAESNRYAHGSIADTIYIAQGSSADYYFWKKGTLSLGIEMGNDKIPSPSEFPDYVRSQEESTWRFLEGI